MGQEMCDYPVDPLIGGSWDEQNSLTSCRPSETCHQCLFAHVTPGSVPTVMKKPQSVTGIEDSACKARRGVWGELEVQTVRARGTFPGTVHQDSSLQMSVGLSWEWGYLVQFPPKRLGEVMGEADSHSSLRRNFPHLSTCQQDSLPCGQWVLCNFKRQGTETHLSLVQAKQENC